MNNNDKFDYTYSAPTEEQRREIESIKSQYTVVPQTDDKIDLLRSLNNRVNQPPSIVGLTLGIVGILILGVGMSLVLVWEFMLWGIVIGVIGVVIIIAAYPIYRAMLKHNKKKYGEQIIKLSDELLNGEDERH